MIMWSSCWKPKKLCFYLSGLHYCKQKMPKLSHTSWFLYLDIPYDFQQNYWWIGGMIWYAMWLPFSLTRERYLNPNHTFCWYTGWITSLLLEVQCTGEAGWESQYHQYSRCRILVTLQISIQLTCLTLSSLASWLPKLWVNQCIDVFE